MESWARSTWNFGYRLELPYDHPCLHVDCPTPKRTRLAPTFPWKAPLRKVKWMIVTVMLPEFIFAHAIEGLKMALVDLFALKEREDELKKSGWSVSTNSWLEFLHGILNNPKWTSSSLLIKRPIFSRKGNGRG
jgi:hypothetical protein